MSAYHLLYLSLFRGCIILRCVHFFLIFLLIINREPDSVLFVSANKKRLQNKFTDKLKANLWIHLDLAKVYRLKELASPYIIYLHFLNLRNILTLPKLLPLLNLCLIWHKLCLVFDSISSNIDEILSIKPSAIVQSPNFNVYHKD